MGLTMRRRAIHSSLRNRLCWEPSPLVIPSATTRCFLLAVLVLFECDIECDALEELSIGGGENGAFHYVPELSLSSAWFISLWLVDLPSLQRIIIKRNSFNHTTSVAFECTMVVKRIMNRFACFEGNWSGREHLLWWRGQWGLSSVLSFQVQRVSRHER